MTERRAPLLSLRAGAGDVGCAASIPEPLCVGPPGRQFLFGGIALAAAIEALERRTGLPAIFASLQFLAQARPGNRLRFDTELAADGRSTRQCRVTGWRGETMFVQGHGACGRRDDPALHQGAPMPVVPAPEQCPERSVARLLSSNLNALLEFRLAAGAFPDRADWTGQGGVDLLCWVRARDGAPLDRRRLAVIGDCAALALAGALGRPASGSSLDNMIRFTAEPKGKWTLAQMRVEGVGAGIAHVATRLFSEEGTLLALAGQSMLLRNGGTG
ncbi:MAG TPA: thioesterase family protein [Sphingopyxis sp.]|nr:thioesterase family protein [Sphingopyxis sp.]HMP45851.1 thioesterase family protein [Sphingopyxis sp.]HMQ17742.1 thioesterase family protein [Sphingopyxis sp.]